MTLYVLKNEHYLNNLKNLKDTDTVILNNSISKFILDFILEDYSSIKSIKINTFTLNELLEGKLDHMKFNYIIGNPPYQDGTKAGGQNKIYNLISKKCLNLLTDDGIINFITPIAVTRESKRFSIKNIQGLKSINFDANEYFNVGISVCSWIIDKSYTGKVEVTANNKKYYQDPSLIYNPDTTNEEFIKLYNAIKYHTKNINNRMFQRNNFGDKLYNGSYDIYSRINGPVTYKSQRKPFFYKSNKCLFRLSGSYNNGFFMSTKDMDLNHICIEVTEEEFLNIQSFVYSEYFINLAHQWKKYTNSKSYDILTYLPVFDKTKKWTNDEVKEFFKGLV